MLRAAHRLDHVAEKGRMQVAEVADRAAVGFERGQYRYAVAAWPGPSPASNAPPFLVERDEILSVELKMRCVLARQNGVGLRSGGDEQSTGWQLWLRRLRSRRRRLSIFCSATRSART